MKWRLVASCLGIALMIGCTNSVGPTTSNVEISSAAAGNLPPTVAITRPALRSVVVGSDNTLVIGWSGSDPDGPESALGFDVSLSRKGAGTISWPVNPGEPDSTSLVLSPGVYELTLRVVAYEPGQGGLVSEPAIMTFVARVGSDGKPSSGPIRVVQQQG